MSEQEMVLAMAQHGYWFDSLDSYDSWLIFRNAYGSLCFESWKDVDEYLDMVVWDELAE